MIEGAHWAGVDRLVYVASAAVYPAKAAMPLVEDRVLDGAPDPAHQGYAAAKRAGMALCRAMADQHGRGYLSALPTNLFGPSLHGGERAHVIAAMLGAGADRFEVWGTGRETRDFLHVEDAADALLCLLEHGAPGSVVNVGSSREVSIADLARRIAHVAGFTGEIAFLTDRPESAPRRVLDTARLRALGWAGPGDLDKQLALAWQARQGVPHGN